MMGHHGGSAPVARIFTTQLDTIQTMYVEADCIHALRCIFIEPFLCVMRNGDGHQQWQETRLHEITGFVAQNVHLAEIQEAAGLTIRYSEERPLEKRISEEGKRIIAI